MMNGPNPSNRFMGLMLRALGRTHFEYEDDEESVGRGELPGYYGGRERGMRVVGWMVGGLVVWSLVGLWGGVCGGGRFEGDGEMLLEKRMGICGFCIDWVGIWGWKRWKHGM